MSNTKVTKEAQRTPRVLNTYFAEVSKGRGARASLRRFGPRPHRRSIVVAERAGDVAGRVFVRPDFADRRDLRRRAGDEAFGEARQLLRHDAALGDFDAAAAGELDHRLAGDASEEAIGDRRVDDAVLDEKDVGASAFGDAALPIVHQRV